MRAPRYETVAVSPHRLVALADGVFAIVMTLLVFQLAVPAASDAADNAALWRELREMWPDFLIYGLSFLVLGVLWLIHHMLFDAIERYDTTLVWLNVLFLMFAALIPFSTALFGEHGLETVTALVYGVNMLAVFDTGWVIYRYDTAGGRLVRADYDQALERDASRMGAVYTGLMVVPLALALAAPLVSFLIYGGLVAAFIGFTLAGRWDVVVAAPGRRRSRA